MRAREFLPEGKGNRQGDLAHGFSSAESDPMVTTYAFPGMPGNNAYRAYRFAMAMANHEMPHEDGPTSQFAVISAYTDAEEQIIKSAMKSTGEKGFLAGNRGSQESKSTNTVSPVAQKKTNRFGV